jgi:hypothetical protein
MIKRAKKTSRRSTRTASQSMRNTKGVAKTAKPKKPKYKHNRPEYLTKEYQAFVKAVRERDNCRCQFPSCRRHRFGIIVHHIIRWTDSVSLRYNPINGICLCAKCHDKVTGCEMAYAALFFQIVQQNIIKKSNDKQAAP